MISNSVPTEVPENGIFEEKYKKYQPPTVVRIRMKNKVEVVSCDEYIGRNMYQGGWKLSKSPLHNPFVVKPGGMTREQAIEAFRDHLLNSPDLMAMIPSLAGKTLGCWCKPLPCHGDAIVEVFKTIMWEPAGLK